MKGTAMARRLLLLLIVVLFGFAALAPVTAQEQPTKPDGEKTEELTGQQQANLEVLDAVLKAIRTRFFDKKYRGKNLRKLRTAYLKRAKDAKPAEPLHAVINDMLAEFKVSHLTIIEGDVYQVHFEPEMNNTLSLRHGFDLSELRDGEYFVSGILQDSAAESAGLKRGDRIVLVNGDPIEDSPLLVDAGGDQGMGGNAHYFIRVPKGDTGEILLGIQRNASDEKLTSIKITPSLINMIHATRKSVAVIEHRGRKFGYIRFWHFLHGGMASALKRALKRDWTLVDGIIIDLRGRGGSPMVMNRCFAPFGKPPSGLGYPGMRRVRDWGMPTWKRPVVALQDAGSRSAKEIYAHNWKYLEIGPLVGESSPGAVLGSGFIPLPDGAYLLLPQTEAAALTYGRVRLEANPVKPTHPVKDLLAYAAGTDTIKEAGIKVLYELVKDLPAPKEEAEELEEVEEDFSIVPQDAARLFRRAG